MSNLKSEILAQLEKPRLAAVATITEGGLPWVRYMMVSADKDLTIRSATFANSRKIGHLKKNPEVHLTFGIDAVGQMATYFQVQGKAVFDATPAVKKAYWNDQLKNYFKGPDDPNYGVMIVKPYKIEAWKPGATKPEIWKAA